MIRLATVFSGIGAIEHAFQRMGLKHKIVFACDNGDVNILSKNVEVDIDTIDEELNSLKKIIIKNSLNTINELYDKLIECSSMFNMYKESLPLKQLPISDCLKVLNIILKDNISKNKVKEYMDFSNQLSSNKSNEAKCLVVIKCWLQLVKEFFKDNKKLNLDLNYKSSNNIKWENVINDLYKYYNILEQLDAKKILANFKELSEQLSMLHERISSADIINELSKIKDFKAKKQYVDDLYKDKLSSNKVRQSYFANYDITEDNFHWNVSFLDGNQYKGKVDIFVGGSPCQSFSLVGKQRGLDDTRGTLFYEFARLVKEIQPKVFIYENVKAIQSNDNGNTWKTMQSVFTNLGYNWHYKVLNAKDYGIPQNRERLFVVGFRKDISLKKEFQFPKAIPLEKKMKDFLLDNVSGKYYLSKKGVEFVTNEKNLNKRFTQIDGDIQLCQKKNQQFNWHGDFVFIEENKNMEKTMQDLEKYFLSEKVKKYVLSSGTKGFYSKPKINLEIARPLLNTMHKMHRAGVDNYVTTNGRLRKLTPRECLRLMGFCDSFKIVVSDTSMYQQAGNSIVVDVLINIMKQILLSYPNLDNER